LDDPATPIDEMAEAMDTIVRSGRARYIGVSNILAYRLAKALGRQDTLKLTRFVSAQPRYNLLFREVERELFPLVQEEGLAVIPFNPLAGGLLSANTNTAIRLRRVAFRRNSADSGKCIMPGIGTSASLKQLPGFRKSLNSMERQ
jgi:aryl-alcohol dehydrogenase-like predicted oxidoreductase